jgi:hypothetical protein
MNDPGRRPLCERCDPREVTINGLETAADLREKATRYRAMVHLVTDLRLINALLSLATEYEAFAERIERDGTEIEE